MATALLAAGVGCSGNASREHAHQPGPATSSHSASPSALPQPGSKSAAAIPATNSNLARPSNAEGPYPVSEVVDGDTDKVEINGRTVTLRLIGIDTPETKHPSKPVECFGPQASARAEQLLTGRSVWIQYDATQNRRDVYGRDLVYVWLDSHTMFNELMVRTGFAHEYTYDKPYLYQRRFRADEAAARASGLGFWARQTCDGNTLQPAAKAPMPSLPVSPSPVPTDSGEQVYYSSCSAVRAAGKAPLLKGQPGYRSGLDGDHNGVACQ